MDEASPLCDARLPDGSRVNVVIPPLSLGGPCLTIRRFRQRGFSLRELVDAGTLPRELADFLALCVAARGSILVSGGTGSGKTTMLNALSGAIAGEERIVTIEDAAELRLRQRHVVRLESRPANLEGRGEISIRQLVRNALRMRPDRIVVGEVRGGEALDMLQALNTGHDGSLTTVHANSPGDALRRIETLALMAGVGLPHAAVREQVSSAIDLVVHQARLPDGTRVVESTAEVVRVAGGAGARQLYRRGGPLREPGDGALRPAPQGSRVVSAPLTAFAAGALALLTLNELGALALRPLAARAPRVARAAAAALDALVLLGREGRDPGAAERRRLLLGGSLLAFAAGWTVAGLPAALACASAGPYAVARLLRARRERFGRAVDSAAPALALAIADAIGGGHSLRGAVAEAARSLHGPGAQELRRTAAELAAGARTEVALEGLRERAGSERVDTIVAACLLQRRAGGDLARLLRHCARAFEDDARLRGEVRAATAQARFTGLVVVLLPLGGALLAELASPGFLAELWHSPLTAWLVGLALALQVGGRRRDPQAGEAGLVSGA